MPFLTTPLLDSKFALNALEFIGLIGGTEVISVMTVIPLYRGRRWLGWYNTPGSLDIARHLANFASSFQERPYKSLSPTALFGLDSEVGPKFIAAFSGAEIQSGHLGYLTIERCKEMVVELEISIEGRETLPTSVIVLDCQEIDLDRPLPLLHIGHTLLALIPIITSISTCLLCGFVSDWYMFAVILAGMFTSGFASMVIGSGTLSFRSPPSAQASSPGNGVLLSERTMVVVRGNESTVQTITRGRFSLNGSGLWQTAIRLCSVVYLAECLAQLILIPQGTLFGQIMFIISLFVSWMYSYRLASFKKERIQAELLFSILGDPGLRKFRVGTRTATAVFVCLQLFHGVRHLASANEYDRLLSAFFPSTTPVWKTWREKVVRQLEQEDDVTLSHLQVTEDHGHSTPDSVLLEYLLKDAEAAFRGYMNNLEPPTSYDPSFKEKL